MTVSPDGISTGEVRSSGWQLVENRTVPPAATAARKLDSSHEASVVSARADSAVNTNMAATTAAVAAPQDKRPARYIVPPTPRQGRARTDDAAGATPMTEPSGLLTARLPSGPVEEQSFERGLRSVADSQARIRSTVLGCAEVLRGSFTRPPGWH
ncbi:MAG: hypothetical protein DLM61_05440 [Pseudonocardiales bacterium]|nr:MAG: hypothetical protein DLM61_05440 [Pseudonocardiales bacterium]